MERNTIMTIITRFCVDGIDCESGSSIQCVLPHGSKHIPFKALASRWMHKRAAGFEITPAPVCVVRTCLPCILHHCYFDYFDRKSGWNFFYFKTKDKRQKNQVLNILGHISHLWNTIVVIIIIWEQTRYNHDHRITLGSFICTYVHRHTILCENQTLQFNLTYLKLREH